MHDGQARDVTPVCCCTHYASPLVARIQVNASWPSVATPRALLRVSIDADKKPSKAAPASPVCSTHKPPPRLTQGGRAQLVYSSRPSRGLADATLLPLMLFHIYAPSELTAYAIHSVLNISRGTGALV